MHGFINNSEVLACLDESDLNRPGTWTAGKPGNYLGPTSEEKVAARLGGRPEDYTAPVNWLRWAKSTGMLDTANKIERMRVQVLGWRRELNERTTTAPAAKPRLATRRIKGATQPTTTFDPTDPAAVERLRNDIAALRPPGDPAELLRTCKHEAGHALLVLVYRGEVTSIRIHGDRSGACYYRGINDHIEPVVALAGCVATNEFITAPGCQSDKKMLLDNIRQSINTSRGFMGPTDATDEMLLNAVYADYEHVRETIDREFKFFDAVVKQLVERRSMPGPEVHRLWNEVRTNRV